MIKKSTYYSWLWEDATNFFRFSIKPTNKRLNTKEKIALYGKLADFHKDYAVISRKYQIGEIFSSEYLDDNNFVIDDFYLKDFKQNLKYNDEFTFFPYWINNDSIMEEILFPDPSKKIYNLSGVMLISKIFHHNDQEELIGKYVYGITTADKFKKFDYYDSWLNEKELGDDFMDFLMEGISIHETHFYSPIWFGFSMRTDLFYPFLHHPDLTDSTLYGKVIDNREIAYLNAPRFNSFLRDLKDVFVNKYGWDFEFQDTASSTSYVRYITEDGILIDNKIIYQEDIESGKVKIPSFT